MNRSKDQILRDLDPTRPETIQALIDHHRRTLGGFVMEDGDGKDGDADKGKNGDTGKDGDADKGKSGDTGKDRDADTSKDSGTDDEKDLGEAGKRAIRAEREARKALEKKLSDFETAQADQAKKLAAALGIETKDAKSSDDVLDSLKKEVTDLRLNLLVDQIARDTKVTDEDDIALIRGAGNEDAMRKLAARLAPKTGDGKKSDGTDDGDDDSADKKRRRPRQDTSQGKGGGGQEKSGLDAGKAEALRRFPSKRQ